MASAEEPVPIPKLNCAIPHISIDELAHLIIDNLQSMKELAIRDELSIYVVSIIVGSFVHKGDFAESRRNHECPAFVKNLLETPGLQLSPALLEHVRQHNIGTININQYMFLIDPMYSQEQHAVPHGLVSVYPSVLYNPIIAANGVITNDEMHIKYNSFIAPYIIPHNIDERGVNNIIAKFQTLGCGSLLINLMDCTSNTLRRLWMQNTAPNVYLAMPDCLAKDDTPMYMPVITYATTGLRWINWALDNEFALVYQLISPHTYKCLTHNYKRQALETYLIPISKILSRMRVSLECTLDDGTCIIFNRMSFQEFRDLWIHRASFAPLFISFMDEYYKWNYYKFIEILLDTQSDNKESREPSMQKILLGYLKEHLKQLKAFFPTDPIPEYYAYVEDDRRMQLLINDYLHENGIH